MDLLNCINYYEIAEQQKIRRNHPLKTFSGDKGKNKDINEWKV